MLTLTEIILEMSLNLKGFGREAVLMGLLRLCSSHHCQCFAFCLELKVLLGITGQHTGSSLLSRFLHCCTESELLRLNPRAKNDHFDKVKKKFEIEKLGSRK